MPNVTFFREGSNKDGLLVLGGLNGVKRSFRQIRAVWTSVTLTVDQCGRVDLRSCKPVEIELTSGKHRLDISGKGFAGSHKNVNVDDEGGRIFAVHPDVNVGVSAETPIGQLSIFEVTDFRSLEPYRSYRNMPTSFGKGSLTHSVLISITAGCVLLGFGLLCVAGLIRAVFRHNLQATLFIGALDVILVPVCITLGMTSIVIGVRFLRLPLTWRRDL
jgi:hypothetical protein